MGEATVSHAAVHRPRAAHLGPERRRPQVLDAAKAIALHGGIPAVTIGAVAERLGVTRPVVYACFADRIELIKALLAREEQKLLTGVLAAYPTPGRRRDSAQQAFVGGMQALLRTVADQPDSWRTLFWCNPGPDVAELFARGRRRVAEQFAELIQPDLHRWETQDAARKLPVLVELFVSMGEAGVRSLLAPDNTYSPDELGELVGRAAYRAIRHA
ncbi:TetR family transcriptional regulator [Mycobacterium kyorinense]|uniref:TetR family transcriptional regulator n=1 Tax=Mycobacterium kyorinense TaxID=487514 RepID=A0A1A2YU94_9MYCO|nr:TetR/AcrR family transcriptional regulator [Mycobacterium kyorinense]OBI40807.1 TetR family transcriptional regulator [Mycobacterium kyorinense]